MRTCQQRLGRWYIVRRVFHTCCYSRSDSLVDNDLDGKRNGEKVDLMTDVETLLNTGLERIIFTQKFINS